MLYHLFTWLEQEYHIPGARLFQYITFRAGLSILISLVIMLFFGKRLIGMIKNWQVRTKLRVLAQQQGIVLQHDGKDIDLEEQRNLGLPEEQLKAKTPTMGGIIIHLAILVPCLLLADLTNVYIQLMLLATVIMGFIGFLDDYLKLTKGKDGLAGRYKIMGQVFLGAVVGATMLFHDDVVVRVSKDDVQRYSYEVVDTVQVTHEHLGTKEEMYHVKTTMTNVPFFKGNEFDYRVLIGFLGDNAKNYVWLIFIPIIIFILTAVSNAANLTDGIDGLAAGTSAIIGATLAVLAYVSGNTVLADYLGVLYVPHAGELAIFTACFMGACIGFLWYNAYPAKVFMGDTGSLALGSIIAVLAIIIRKELLIPVLCGVFLVENLSVVLQVAVFKYRKKKYGLEYAQKNRLFLMSPLHHHFQKQGMHESQIVVRFWIVGIMLAVLTIITLKIR